jgi:hypothetical protein
LSFAALGDLLDDAIDDVIDTLSPPQQRELRVALARADADRPPDSRMLAVAVVAALRALSDNGRVLIGVALNLGGGSFGSPAFFASAGCRWVA